MGDWNTLHYFDSRAFCVNPVTDLPSGLLQRSYRSVRGQSLFFRPTEQRLQAMLELVGSLQDGFVLPAGGATSSDSEQAIEDVNLLLPLVVFAKYAFFSPRFRLGKSLLSNCARYARPNTLIEEALDRVFWPKTGSILANYGDGIKNWLTAEELALAMLDADALVGNGEESRPFVDALKQFCQLGVDNGLGLLCGVNLPEDQLDDLSSGLPFSVDFPVFGTYPLLR